MPLAHFTNVQSHYNNDEPIFKSLFEVTVILPTLLQSIHPNAPVLLLENITSIDLPAYKDLSSVEQRFKYSTRKFLGIPTETSAEFSMKLNMNVDQQSRVFTWRVMKDWYDLGWNNEDGSLHYKRHLIGDVIVNMHDKEGHIIRRLTYHNCQMKQITGWDGSLAWGGGTDIFTELNCNFVADYWSDFYY